MSRVFLSHSIRDSLQAQALKIWLEKVEPGLVGEIFLDLDGETGISVGMRWKEAMRQAHSRCETVICLLSRAWEASAECKTEYRLAEGLGKTILCARLEELGDTDITSEWQRCDLFAAGDETKIEVPGGPPVRFNATALDQLRRAIAGNGVGPENFVWPPGSDAGRAPYRGWEPFEDIDAGVFYGRDAAIVRGLEELRAMRLSGLKPLFIVLGPSGSGKSSFLRAGLIPRLQREDRRFLVLGIMRPERAALTGDRGLAAAIHAGYRAVSTRDILLEEIKNACLNNASRVAELLVELRDAAAVQFANVGEDVPAPTLVLPLDQAEELFSVDAGGQAEQFLQLIAEVLGKVNTAEVALIVAATIRTDRYEVMQNHSALDGINTVLFNDLKPMPPWEFKEVITGPAKRATQAGNWLDVADELVERLLAECSLGADSLPLLALTLARMYQDYGDDRKLSLAEYEAMGGMRQVVQIEIDQILSPDPDHKRSQLELLRAAFIPWLASINPDNDQPMRRVARWSDLPAQSHALIDMFVAKRLLIKDERDGEVVVEVAMDSLLRQWDELAEWLRAERDDILAADDIERAVRAWERNGRNAAWLLAGQRLQSAEALAEKPAFRHRLEPARAYLQASRRGDDRLAAAVSHRKDASVSDALQQKLRALLESDRFIPYRDHQATITESFIDSLASLEKRAESWQTSVAACEDTRNLCHRSIKRLEPITLAFRIIATTLALAGIAGVISLFIFRSDLHHYWLWLISSMPLLAIFVAVMWGIEAKKNRLRTRLRKAEQEYENARLAYEQQAEAMVEEECTRIINAKLGSIGLSSFRTKAPRLIEIETSEVVPFRSLEYLRDFIKGHDSSAIGVAGPRGSGKTTLLNALTDDETLTPHSVLLTAPVHYDACDFLRRLYLDVAKMIDKEAGERAVAARRAREDRIVLSRAALALGAVFVGVLLALPGMVGPDAWLLSRIDSLGRLGLAIAGVGCLAFGYMAVNQISRSGDVRQKLRAHDSSASKRSSRLAAEAIENLTFTSERSAKTKNAFSIFGKAFSMEDEDSLTLRSREQSPADLANGLRILLRMFAAESKHRVLVAIDELDKISTTDDLIETINGLKDLFHVKGVHFVVSVSTDALRSFEQRGLVSRDAFDSSFDTIIGVKPLTSNESLELLDSRAEGFPEELAVFCHAWSGGLPRELLRVARRCVEIERYSDSLLPSITLIRSVISEDLAALVEAELRGDNLSEEHLEYLCQLRQHTEKLRQDIQTEPLPVQPANFMCPVVDTVSLGCTLVRFFTTLAELGRTSQTEGAYGPLETAAYAMACRTDARGIRTEAFEAALRACCTDQVREAEGVITNGSRSVSAARY
jgi:Cdc6-like AAA superfamily ATPase